MARVVGNLRLALRMLRSQPVLGAMAILMIGLGIGLTTTTFSVVNATLIRGLPFEDPHALVVVRSTRLRASDNVSVRHHDYLDWRDRQASFRGLAAFSMAGVAFGAADAAADRRDAAYVTANAFRQLGTSPLLGRMFTEEEARRGGEPVVVIGYGLWQTSLGGRREVLGETVRIDGQPHTLIGIMGPEFAFPNVEELWLPLRIEPREGERTAAGLTVFGRLKDGASIGSAQADLDVVAESLAAEYPETNAGVGAHVMKFSDWALGDEIPAFLSAMLLASGAVLLIACVNVANLLLARAASRTRDMAVRIAVGASRRQVVFQFVAEAVVLAAGGALVGLGIGSLGIRWFEDAVVAGTTPPFWLDFSIDRTVAAFILLSAAGSAVLAGTLPALQASATRVNDILKDEARGSSSLRMSRVSRWLVVSEIALSFGLLVAAGLAARSVLAVRNFDSGMDDARVFVGQIILNTDGYPAAERRRAFWSRLIDDLAARTDVVSAAWISNLPGLGAPGTYFEIEGRSYGTPEDRPVSQWSWVGRGFFDVVGLEPGKGRTFVREDATGFPAVVVNENFERLYFPGGTALGERIRTGREDPWMEIVGVVPNIPIGYFGDSPPPMENPGFYRLDEQPTGAWILVRTRSSPLGIATDVRDLVHKLDPALAVAGINTLDETIVDEMWHVDVLGTLFIAFGLGALFMASIGLYSVMAFSVRRRRGEIGVRMTLGATSGDILRLFVKEGLRQIFFGLALGLGLAILLGRAIRIFLYEVEASDPLTFICVALGLIAVGLAASYIPARRAAMMDPAEAIR